MRGRLSVPVALAGALGLALLALGGVYLSVACQSLPRFMGPVHGDSSPRTGLGLIALVLGLAALAVGFATWRRQAPPS